MPALTNISPMAIHLSFAAQGSSSPTVILTPVILNEVKNLAKKLIQRIIN